MKTRDQGSCRNARRNRAVVRTAGIAAGLLFFAGTVFPALPAFAGVYQRGAAAARTATARTTAAQASAATQTAAGQIVTSPGSDSAAADTGSSGVTAETLTAGLTYDVSRFSLPDDAETLIVVEGFAVNGGRDVYKAGSSDKSLWNRARVTAFAKDEAGNWAAKVQSAGVYGWGGMSNARHSGDGTTPIGLWKTDTPFGRKEALEGFPSDYVKIDVAAQSQYWSDVTNRLESSTDFSSQSGERLYADWAEGIYDYCLNSGFNLNNAQKGTGTALFLHCTKENKTSTAGCVAIDPEAMKAILCLYARGGCYIAQAPAGQFETVYGAFSASGAAAPGTFTDAGVQMPEVRTAILK